MPAPIRPAVVMAIITAIRSLFRAEFRPVIAACCAVLVGIGLSRFAYSPLVPAMIDARWFTPDAAAYLGAANLAGYLGGAMLGRVITRWVPLLPVLRGAMLLSALAFVACAWPQSYWWFFPWRVLSGMTGGVLMVLAAPAVLPGLPQGLRGRASGVIFAGVGLGIALSGTVEPVLIAIDLTVVWLALAVISLLLTILVWNFWPEQGALPRHGAAPKTVPQPASTGQAANASASATPPAHSHAPSHAHAIPPIAYVVSLAYGIVAISFVPHMVLLSDVIARNLGFGINAAAASWVLFGIGASIGPVLGGWLADRLTFGPALLIFLIVEIPAIIAPAWLVSPVALNISAFIVGAAVPGVVPLVLGRVHEIIPDHTARHKIWSLSTMTFAAGQAAAGYVFSWLYTRPDSHFGILFELAALAMFVSMLLFIATRRAGRG